MSKDNEIEVHPEWTKGYHVGLHQGYHMALEDFKVGLRSVWKKDENDNYYIAEKYYFADPDEAEMSGASVGEGDQQFVLSPAQMQAFNAHINNLLFQLGEKRPELRGKHFHALLLAPGAETHNWGVIKRFKLLVTQNIVALLSPIPESEILFFVDYDP